MIISNVRCNRHINYMNIFEEISSKYKGFFNEEGKKVVSGPEGKLFFDAKETVVNVKGSLITLYSTGAVGAADPIRIILFLKKDSETDLTIFPKSWNKKFIEFFIPRKSLEIPSKIRNQFAFGGNENLIKELISDRIFIEDLLNENIYIVINKKTSRNILLTPAFGLKNLKQFDKYVDILKTIESKLSIINKNT